MYQLSRAIYRELAPHICTGRGGHADVLASCESAVERLATDRHYFSNPARTLFRDVRVNFPLQAQDRVWTIVRDYVDVSEKLLDSLTTRGRDAFGNKLACRATTRRGSPCQRIPVHANGYCPSHQHLAATEELADAHELDLAA
jgi:hypothetical protein